ncbi:protein hgh1 homolog [Plakobranchus ocellatus]|uniref:Protein HGH1 homolog n=1 Tax=Plakobranchus ocellatus TaxID=259542 RepID=A0AAV4B982_9GAST|nr:protein hgh1 homolog [Plakobranchus ocellatus]
MALDQATKLHLEKEMLPFLKKEARGDVKSIAIRYFLEMTGSKEGRDFIGEGDKFLPAIFDLTLDSHSDIARDAYLCLINLSAEETIAWKLMMNIPNGSALILDLLHRVLKPECLHADEATSIIANVTRIPGCAKQLAQQILSSESKVTMESIVNVLCHTKFNKNASMHYIGPILANLTQVSEIRKIIMDKQRCIVQKLLPFTEFQDSLIRRGGILGALKNCCFEYDYHAWLLSDEVDILSRLLLPLAGGEEFDEDDMERLPVDLQYLSPDKQREQDPDLRLMLLQAITQLCATKQGRLYIKDKNAYVILREYHKWEKDPKAYLACQKLCEMLISDEPQEGMEDLHKVDVPADLAEEFEKLDADLLSDYEEAAKKEDTIEQSESESEKKLGQENTKASVENKPQKQATEVPVEKT